MIKAIIFDYDDTLVKTLECRVKAIVACAKEDFGIALSTQTVTEFWGRPFNEIFIKLFNLDPENKANKTEEEVKAINDRLDAVKAKYYETIKRFPNKLHENVNEVIQNLADKGYKLGIMSSLHEALLTKDSIETGLNRDLFFFIQSADDTDVHKPDPKAFTPTFNKLNAFNIKPNETVYVGDAISDFVAAKAANMEFIGITSGKVTKAEFEKEGARVISRMNDLVPLIESLNTK